MTRVRDRARKILVLNVIQAIADLIISARGF